MNDRLVNAVNIGYGPEKHEHDELHHCIMGNKNVFHSLVMLCFGAL